MGMITGFLHHLADFSSWHWYRSAYLLKLVMLLLPLLAVQVHQHYAGRIEVWTGWPVPLRAAFYVGLFYSIVLFGSPEYSAFIYFQF
jgi:hypothetical protein